MNRYIASTDWQECRAVRFDSPRETHRLQIRRGERVVMLSPGEVPVATDLGGPGVYTVDIPVTYSNARFPVLVAAVPAMIAVLLTRGGPIAALPEVPAADPHTGGSV